jgi:cob(I)alamin adenosyltransferase
MYFTGKGDNGKTEINGKKFAKDSLIFEVLGELDELNSLIGLAKNYLPKKFFKKLTEIQNDLFIIQANVAYHLYNADMNGYNTDEGGCSINADKRGFKRACLPARQGLTQTKFNLPKLKEERIKEIEKEIREIEKKIKTQKSFVIYGSDKDSAWFDYLRGVTRRVERRMVKFYTRINTDSTQINTDKNNPRKSALDQCESALRYFNRLSSYFYALARFICYNKRIKERSPWY